MAFVRIFNGRTQVASHLEIKSFKAEYSKKVLRHILESGSTVVDTSVRMGRVITINGIVPDQTTANELVASFLAITSLMTIRTGVMIYRNLMVEQGGINLSPDMMYGVNVQIQFKEIIVDPNIPIKPEQPADGAVSDNGIIQVLHEVTENVKEFFSGLF